MKSPQNRTTPNTTDPHSVRLIGLENDLGYDIMLATYYRNNPLESSLKSFFASLYIDLTRYRYICYTMSVGEL